AGVAQARAGNHVGDIGHAVQQVAEGAGYSVVRELVGHGIGSAFHEDPQVPNYGKPRRGPRLVPGMTIAIEPMVNVGGADIRTLDDKWTVVTEDGSLSAHFEHTVAILENGGPPRALTTAHSGVTLGHAPCCPPTARNSASAAGCRRTLLRTSTFWPLPSRPSTANAPRPPAARTVAC